MARWNRKKNEILKITRGISFEEIVEAAAFDTLADYEHPNKDNYSELNCLEKIWR